MLAVDFLIWWYSRGWAHFTHTLLDKIRNLTDFFSISLLLRTLFAPFRQISAQSSNSNDPMAYIRDFFDKLLSRIIGAIVRLMILIFGSLTILIEFICGLLLVICWPLIPLTPVLCAVLFVMGVKIG